MKGFNILVACALCLILSALPVCAYEQYPARILYLRDLGTKYTGETVSFTAEVVTLTGEECKNCRVWFYVDGPDWEGEHWIGYALYSDLSSHGLYTVEWKIAPGMAAGTYNYYAQVKDSYGNIRSKASSGYSFQVVAENMRARVIGLWPVDDSSAGSDVIFLVQVKNTGDSPLDHNCQVKFHVTASDGSQTYNAGSRACTTDDYSGTTDVLGVGMTRWYKLPWAIPYISGKYSYYATVEYKGREINEIPPTSSFNVIEPRRASIRAMASVPDARTGTSVNLGVLVENSADIVLADGCRIAYYVRGPSRGGLKLEGIVGYSDCAQTGSSLLAPLTYKEQRKYSLRWTPPIAGEYFYNAVVKYKEKEISPWSAEQSFRVGDDVATTSMASTTTTMAEEAETPEEKTSHELAPPETLLEDEPEAIRTTTSISSSSTQTTVEERQENDSSQAPKAAGNVTGITLDNPFMSLISIVALALSVLYIIYRMTKNLKKPIMVEGKNN